MPRLVTVNTENDATALQKATSEVTKKLQSQQWMLELVTTMEKTARNDAESYNPHRKKLQAAITEIMAER